MKSTAALLKVDRGMRSQRHVWAARLGLKVLPNTDHGCTLTFDPELSRGDNIHLVHFLRASYGKDLPQINTLSIKTSDTSASLVKQDGTFDCWQFASPSGSIQQADVAWLLLCLQALHPLQPPQTVRPLPLPEARLARPSEPEARLARQSELEARLVHGLWRIIAGVSTEKTAYCGLNDCGVNDETICAIAQRLGVNTVLTSLRLSDNLIGAEGAKSIGKALKVNSVLTSLNLWRNDIGDEGAKAIAEALRVNSVLTSLNLATNNLIGETYYIKASTVQGKSFNVGDKVTYQGREMIVSRGKDSDGDIKMKPLEWLSGIAAIADALRVNSVLTSLDLAYNQMGEGAKAIGEALHVNGVLTELGLAGNQVGAEGAKAIGDALRVNSVLTSLDLAYNQMGDGKAALRKIADSRPSLTLKL